MIHLVVEAPWLARLIGSALGWAALVLLVVYLFAGPWWTLAVAVVFLVLALAVLHLVRRWTR